MDSAERSDYGVRIMMGRTSADTAGQCSSAVGAERTLWSVVNERADEFPDKSALVFRDDDEHERSLTFSELRDQVRAASAYFATLGLRRGDRLALWMTNRPEWVVAYLGAARIGACVVPINTWLTAPEVAYVLGQSQSRFLVVLDRLRGRDFLEILTEVAPGWDSAPPGQLFTRDLPDLRHVIVIRREAERPEDDPVSRLGAEAVDHSMLEVSDRMSDAVRPSDLAMIGYTSGSTAFPKGAMLDQHGFVLNALHHTERFHMSADDSWMSAMPMFHNGGYTWGLMSCLVTGATLHFTEAFAPDRSLRMLRDYRCTIWFASPTMARDVLSLPASELEGLDFVRLVSAPDPGLIAAYRERIPNVATMNPYGMTEMFGPISIADPAGPVEDRATNGWPLAGVRIRVVDPETNIDVPAGEVGEAIAQGPMMQGYWNQPEATSAAVDKDGWFHTGDLLRIEDSGRLTYVGRRKNMLRVGSENVGAEEIEYRILQHPGVVTVCAVGVKDWRRGEVAWAYVQLRGDVDVTVEELDSWCRKGLASFKVPRRFVIMPTLPQTGSAKVDRVALKALADEAASEMTDFTDAGS